MSDQRHGSEGSLITFHSHDGSPKHGSLQGEEQGQVQQEVQQDVHRDNRPDHLREEEHENEQGPPSPKTPVSPPSGRSPRSPRVRFKSSLWFDYEDPRTPPSEEKRTEGEQAKRHEQPHRPSTPFEHGSTDIADVPQDQRTSEAAEPQPKESLGKKAEDETKEEAEEVEQSIKDRFMNGAHKIKEKTTHLLNVLGRDEHDGDDLHPGVYHADWGGGGEAPLSDVTDNKHKTEEEKRKHQATANSEAHRLVREMNQDQSAHRRKSRGKPYPHQGSETQEGEDLGIDSGLRYRSGGGGVLSQLMKLNNPQQQQQQGGSRSSSEASPAGTPSGTTTPGTPGTPRKGKPKWYRKQQNMSTSTLIGAGNLSGTSTPVGSQSYSAASKRRSHQPDRKTRLEDEIRVTVHIAEIIARQRYIMQLCKALMMFGAPTHRLEEYMQMTAKVLEVDSQYLYLPGCMIMSFDDPSTRTTEVKLVRVAQGINLGRLANIHTIYKNVIHDVIGVEEAIQELEEFMKKKPRFNKWIVVFVYGLATASVGPFAFEARPIDLPAIFINGCLLALMQHVIAPRSALYSNVFEVTGSVLSSFLARAWGSVPGDIVNGKQEYRFCFSAITQSSIALILPGFLVLCSSLELQSHQIAAGSIRMVYAIIYSLFLGYGITVGTTIYGLIDKKATSETSCSKVGAFKNPYVQRFPFVLITVIWLNIVNQGRFKQLPPMLVIAIAGYVTNYYCTETLGSNSQVANTVGAFTVGVMGNLYSRIWHGHAATTILPGIFVLVPSALAATGSLISGVHSADQIRSNVGQEGQQGGGGAQDTSVTNLGFGMIQVAIGITIGLFLAALVVYPYGKRRSGLFSF